jgi:hypothetical protein
VVLNGRGLSISGLAERLLGERETLPVADRREELTMDTIFILVAALITLAALDFGEAGARVRRQA